MSSQLLASKIVIVEEEPRVRTIVGNQTAITGFLGVTLRGPLGVATLVNSVDEYDEIFGGYTADGDVRQAVDGFFQNGGSTAYVVRTVHYSDVTDPATKTSAPGTVTLLTDTVAAYGGSVTGTVVGPFALAHGDTIIVDTEAISPTTTTITAVAAARETTNTSATPFNLADGMTLTVKIDGGTAQTIAFAASSFVT